MAAKQSKSKSTKNQIDVSPLDEIRQEERLSILAEELIKMRSKRKIVEEYSVKWNCSQIGRAHV